MARAFAVHKWFFTRLYGLRKAPQSVSPRFVRFFCGMSERYTWNVTKLSIELAPKRTVLADERWMWRAGGRNAAVKFCVVRRRGQESGDPACVSFTDRRCWVTDRRCWGVVSVFSLLCSLFCVLPPLFPPPGARHFFFFVPKHAAKVCENSGERSCFPVRMNLAV